MPLQGGLSIERMCQLVVVSRRSFYRSLKERQPAEEEMEVQSAIQQIALEHRRRYGYRRITAELHRRGMQVNHKRVVRIMREDSLLGIQPKRFVVGCWGKGLKCRPLPQTPSPARRCKNTFMKAEAVPK
jgi:putative transposase